MASDPAAHQRVAALTGATGASPRLPGSAAPPGPVPDAPDPGPTGPEEPGAEAPDPEFWGAEPRPVRRSRRVVAPEPGGPPAWWAGLLDRVRDARLEVGVGVVVLLAVALGAGLLWYRMSAGGSDAPPPAPHRGARSAAAGSAATRPAATGSAATRPAALPRDPGTTPASTPSGAAAGRGATVVVHVAGAVARPGVLVMPAGARVIDAVEGAGGALADADLDRLNLAAKLVDGQRVLVVKVGAVGVADATGASGAAGAPGDVGAVVDLNTATSAQLDALPGIGPGLAAAIIAERDRRGGFRSINELREVRGIGEARFADLRERVTV